MEAVALDSVCCCWQVVDDADVDARAHVLCALANISAHVTRKRLHKIALEQHTPSIVDMLVNFISKAQESCYDTGLPMCADPLFEALELHNALGSSILPFPCAHWGRPRGLFTGVGVHLARCRDGVRALSNLALISESAVRSDV